MNFTYYEFDKLIHIIKKIWLWSLGFLNGINATNTRTRKPFCDEDIMLLCIVIYIIQEANNIDYIIHFGKQIDISDNFGIKVYFFLEINVT